MQPPRESLCRGCRRRQPRKRPPRPQSRTPDGRTRAPPWWSRRRRMRHGSRERPRTRPPTGSSIASRVTPSASSFASEIGLSITDAATPSSTSASTSAWTARENPQTSALRPAPRISSMAFESSAETRGKPASIRSTPASSSARAICSLSSGAKTTPTVCSPSRSVVSYRPTVTRGWGSSAFAFRSPVHTFERSSVTAGLSHSRPRELRE
jgi:hypothetical protein